MESTSERILLTALQLFAKGGYEAVSVRDIASQLGITQGALYKHYASKRDIFECIVARMEQNDSDRSRQYEVPQSLPGEATEEYTRVTAAQLAAFTLAQFRYWTEDSFAADFRRMLTLEQYRSPQMSVMYQQYLGSDVIDYTAEIFRALGCSDERYSSDPRLCAIAFFAPVYMLMNQYDASEDKSGVLALAGQHIDRFLAPFH